VDDARLLAMFAGEKSQDAFQEIVRRHIGMVYSVCRRQLRDAHWAEDVTQAVFILLAKKAADLPENVILGGWLYKAAHYACSNARAMQRTRAHHEHQVMPMNSSNGQEALERAEVEGLLDQGLLHLSKAQREVLILRYFENKPLSQIARTRKTSLYSTQKTLDSALAHLRRYLSQRGVAATGVLIAAALTRQAAHAAVPNGLAAAAGNAALGHAASTSAYVSHLAAHLIRHAGRTKLLAALTATAALLLLGTAVIRFHAPGTLPVTAQLPASTSGAAPGDVLAARRSQDEQELWATLHGAEAALRAMDNAALMQAVEFTDAQQAENWDRMARVFLADQTLKQTAAVRFGPQAQTLTAIKTFDARLDEILPQVDSDSLQWEIGLDRAALRFTYRDAQTAGGTLYFRKTDGVWKIDATRSMDVALEGLGSNLTRVAVQQLPAADRQAVLNRMDFMEKLLTQVAGRISAEPDYNLAQARADLQTASDPGQGQAFFHLGLRLNNFDQVRN